MKRFLAMLLVVCMICAFTACSTGGDKEGEWADADTRQSNDTTGLKTGSPSGELQVQDDGKYFKASWVSGLSFAGSEEDAFEDIEPMYNIPDGFEFRINVNPMEDFWLYSVYECFAVYSDRECTKEVGAEINYDAEAGVVTVAPSMDNEWVNTYPREGIETGYIRSEDPDDWHKDIRTWGSLKTLYLVIYIDTKADTVTFLDKPKRMMFTIAAEIDSPTVKVKFNDEGNMMLCWDNVDGAEYYKVYYGNNWRMRELGRTDKTEFLLDDSDEFYKDSQMNSLLSDAYDYAVVAVRGEKESRLSNIIRGEDYAKSAPKFLSTREKRNYTAGEYSIFDLPREVEVRMADVSTAKRYPVIWDFRNHEIDSMGAYTFYGKLPGIRLRLSYKCLGEDLPTEEEIEAFYETVQYPATMAEDNTDKINIQDSPSIKDVPAKTTDEIAIDITGEEKPENQLSLAQHIALGMLNHETTIDLSAYPEAGDPAYLRDVVEMIMTQCVLVLDEEYVTFDFVNKQLKVKYSLSDEESLEKQIRVLEKAEEVLKAVIQDGMSLEEKEKAIHDWIVENGRYHDEILQAYYDGTDLDELVEQHADSFNVYGILVNGLGVCQSYAETFKLLCDLAGVPAVVATGKNGMVPHAWNKVMIGNQWYNVDVTNNDQEVLKYPVYNTCNRILNKYYSESLAYVLDDEFAAYSSDDETQDYYYKAGLYSRTTEELKEMIKANLATSDVFFIKTSPDLTDEEISEILVQALVESGLVQNDIKTLNYLNIIGVKQR